MTAGDPLRSSSVNEDICLLDSPTQPVGLAALSTREMAAFQALKGVIDGCCRSLPVSSLHWQEWDAPGEAALPHTAQPSCSARPRCPRAALLAGGNLPGRTGEGQMKSWERSFPGKGSDISLTSTWRRRSTAARAAEAGWLLQSAGSAWG